MDTLKVIAHIETDFPEKFGIPRQSGLIEELTGTIVFEPEYRSPDAVKGLEGFNYLWLLWEFEIGPREKWTATVRPPRLGGNKTMGVFATRSPFRPNPIGLSSVKITGIEPSTARGPLIYVAGVDLRDKTPIFDIKPYLPFADCHTDAVGGFTDTVRNRELEVFFPEELRARFPAEKLPAMIAVLKQDPRPSYQNDPERIYGVAFAGYNVKFQVRGKALTVLDVTGSERKK